MTSEIKLPEDFNDYKVLQDYFRISDSLAKMATQRRAWLRVKDSVARRMFLDPRLNGMRQRESGDVMDISWWLEENR